MNHKIIYTKDAPEPIGPYSQAVAAEGLIFISGQIAIKPEKGEIVEGGIKEHTRQVLENLKAILESVGSGISHVVKTTVFLKDLNDFAQMNEVYSEYFRDSKPARSTVEVARLPKEVLVEIEAVAVTS